LIQRHSKTDGMTKKRFVFFMNMILRLGNVSNPTEEFLQAWQFPGKDVYLTSIPYFPTAFHVHLSFFDSNSNFTGK
jgi:hypothetical protein